jgi:hypothetical protein
MAAGTVPSAVPTTIAATGIVAHDRDGANWAPIIPPKKNVTEAPAKEKMWAIDNNHTFLLSVGKDIKRA